MSKGFPKDENGHKDEILCLDVSFDGKFLITGSRDKKIKIWNLQSSTFIGDLSGHEGAVNVKKV